MKPYEDEALKRGMEALRRLLNMAAAIRNRETEKAIAHLAEATREMALAKACLDFRDVARDVSAEDLADYLAMIRAWGLNEVEAAS